MLLGLNPGSLALDPLNLKLFLPNLKQLSLNQKRQEVTSSRACPGKNLGPSTVASFTFHSQQQLWQPSTCARTSSCSAGHRPWGRSSSTASWSAGAASRRWGRRRWRSRCSGIRRKWRRKAGRDLVGRSIPLRHPESWKIWSQTFSPQIIILCRTCTLMVMRRMFSLNRGKIMRPCTCCIWHNHTIPRLCTCFRRIFYKIFVHLSKFNKNCLKKSCCCVRYSP